MPQKQKSFTRVSIQEKVSLDVESLHESAAVIPGISLVN